MAQKKYTDGSGVSEIWTNTKNYIAAQLLGKSDVGHTHSASEITDLHIVDTIEEQGTEYIRYTNGIQICWIQGSQSNSVYTWNFPKTFLVSPVVTATIYYPSNKYNVFQRSVELNNLTSTGVLLRAAIHSFGSNSYSSGADYVNAIAIGYWK